MRRLALILGSILVAGLSVWLVARPTRATAPRTGALGPAATDPARGLATELSGAPPLAAPVEQRAAAPTHAVERQSLTTEEVAPRQGACVAGKLFAPRGVALGETRLFWSIAAADGGAPRRLLDFPGADGSFFLDDVPPGVALELRLVPLAAPEQTHRLEPLAPDELRRLELTLDLGAELEGLVQDDLGHALPDVALALDDLRPSDLASLERSELESTLRTSTGPDGRFRFERLGRGEWRLRLEDVPRPPAPLVIDTRAHERQELTVVYPRVPELIVEVLGPDGEPRNARVSAFPPVEFQRRLALGRYRLAGFDGALELEARGFPDGSLVARASGVVAGPGPLRLVLAEDPLQAAATTRSAAPSFFEFNRAFSDGLVVEGPDEQRCELAGRVLDSRGRPLEGARIQLGAQTRTTNARGEFLLEGLEEGSRSVRVHDERTGALSRHEVDLTPDRRVVLEVRLEPTRPVRARGRILDALEEHITLESELGRVSLALDDAGDFELEFPFAGRYSGTLRANDGTRHQLVLDVPFSGVPTWSAGELPLDD